MSDLERRLMRAKKELETAKRELAQAEGRLQSLQQRLLEEFDCKTTKQAEKKLDKLRASIAELTEKLEDGLARVEEAYG